MFRTLESTWDIQGTNQSARRAWTTAISFTMQALALSLLLLVPLFTIQGPPHLAWFDPHLLAPPPAPPAPVPMRVGDHPLRSSNTNGVNLIAPSSIPPTIATTDNRGVVPPPDISQIGVNGSTGDRAGGDGVLGSLGKGVAPAPPPGCTQRFV